MAELHIGAVLFQVSVLAALWCVTHWVIQCVLGLQARMAKPLINISFWLMFAGLWLAFVPKSVDGAILVDGVTARILLFASGYFVFRALRGFVGRQLGSAVRNCLRAYVLTTAAIMGVYGQMSDLIYFVPVFVLMPIATLSLSTTWYQRLSPFERWGSALSVLAGPLFLAWLLLNGSALQDISPEHYRFYLLGGLLLWALEMGKSRWVLQLKERRYFSKARPSSDSDIAVTQPAGLTAKPSFS